jgi:hypothetical protein
MKDERVRLEARERSGVSALPYFVLFVVSGCSEGTWVAAMDLILLSCLSPHYNLSFSCFFSKIFSAISASSGTHLTPPLSRRNLSLLILSFYLARLLFSVISVASVVRVFRPAAALC